MDLGMIKKRYLHTSVLMAVYLSLLTGCVTTFTVSPHYKSGRETPLMIPYDRQLTLFVEPVSGNAEKLWCRMGEYTWFLAKEPTVLVKEALVEELNRMGISVSVNPTTQGLDRLKTKVRWFAPYGNDCVSASVIISVELYSKGGPKPIWRDRLQAGSLIRPTTLTVGGKTSFVQEIISETLTKAIIQLRWNHRFARAVALLAKEQSDLGKEPAGQMNALKKYLLFLHRCGS